MASCFENLPLYLGETRPWGLCQSSGLEKATVDQPKRPRLFSFQFEVLGVLGCGLQVDMIGGKYGYIIPYYVVVTVSQSSRMTLFQA